MVWAVLLSAVRLADLPSAAVILNLLKRFVIWMLLWPLQDCQKSVEIWN